MKTWLKRIAVVLILALVAIQFVPVARDNPAEDGPLEAPLDVAAILARSCDDCHSNRTRWPWYSWVAPVSWVLAGHVEDGRGNLNFSLWGTYSKGKQAHKLEEIVDQVEGRGMPRDDYVLLHPEAELSEADREVLLRWARGG